MNYNYLNAFGIKLLTDTDTETRRTPSDGGLRQRAILTFVLMHSHASRPSAIKRPARRHTLRVGGVVRAFTGSPSCVIVAGHFAPASIPFLNATDKGGDAHRGCVNTHPFAIIVHSILSRLLNTPVSPPQ